jgi:site-specific recombinase XerC
MSRPKPTSLASILRSFFVEYLPRQRALSPHTLCSYRDSIKLLLQFFAQRNGGISKAQSKTLPSRKLQHSCNTSKRRGITASALATFD